jgi:hypothetical protein
MVAQHQPFRNASKNDDYYKPLAINRSDVFWKMHLEEKPFGE